MVEIGSITAGATPSLTTPATRKNNDPEPSVRGFHDTVELSGGGQKIVNLARGIELAEEIRSKPVDGDFAKFLARAMEDINRISQLFRETFNALFRFRR